MAPLSEREFSLSALPSPTIRVVDLTSRHGIYALSQLGVRKAHGYGQWLQLPLGGQQGGPRFDWHRPHDQADLPDLVGGPNAFVIVVGPGSLDIARQAIGRLSRIDAPPAWIFLLPSAVVEEAAVRSSGIDALPNAQIHRLPDSSPQTFWYVLMEQIAALPPPVPESAAAPAPKKANATMNTNLKESISAAMSIDGAVAAALVDYRSGMCLAQAGSGVNLDLAAAGNTEVVRAKLKTIETLGLRRGIEDILITLVDQYHLIRLVPNAQGLFLYLVLDKVKGNLALARFKLSEIESTLVV